jgi:hypothetical protein
MEYEVRLTPTFLARQALHAIFVIRARLWRTSELGMLPIGTLSGVEIRD